MNMKEDLYLLNEYLKGCGYSYTVKKVFFDVDPTIFQPRVNLHTFNENKMMNISLLLEVIKVDKKSDAFAMIVEEIHKKFNGEYVNVE